MIELRVLTAEDWPLWRELRLAALTEAPHAFGARLTDWLGDGDRQERWRARLDMPGSRNLVAVVDAHPAGMVSGVATDDPAVVELISMWVDPSTRGRGVGDLLVSGVNRWARQVGAEAVRLAVAEGNHAGAALYRRNGFHDIGLSEPMPDGVRRERIMVKNLGTATD